MTNCELSYAIQHETKVKPQAEEHIKWQMSTGLQHKQGALIIRAVKQKSVPQTER